MTAPADERDPERFCVCGHHVTEHGPTPAGSRCLAREPDPRCSCAGYRPGRRAHPTDPGEDDLP